MSACLGIPTAAPPAQAPSADTECGCPTGPRAATNLAITGLAPELGYHPVPTLIPLSPPVRGLYTKCGNAVIGALECILAMLQAGVPAEGLCAAACAEIMGYRFTYLDCHSQRITVIAAEATAAIDRRRHDGMSTLAAAGALARLIGYMSCIRQYADYISGFRR